MNLPTLHDIVASDEEFTPEEVVFMVRFMECRLDSVDLLMRCVVCARGDCRLFVVELG